MLTQLSLLFFAYLQVSSKNFYFYILTLNALLNLDISSILESSVDPDQLASNEAI